MGAGATAAFGFPDFKTAPRIRTMMPTMTNIDPTVVSAVVILNVTFVGEPDEPIAPTSTEPPSGWLKLKDPLLPF